MADNKEKISDILEHDNIVRMCQEFCDGTKYQHAFIVGLREDGIVVASFPGQTDAALAVYMLEQAKRGLLERGFADDDWPEVKEKDEGSEEG